MFGRDPSILAEHSFSERDPQNVSRLRRSLQGSGVSFFGDEVGDALKGVYDLNFSRFQRKYREFYRLKLLQNLNVFRGKNTLHRVSPVKGSRDRIIAVFSYYETKGVQFSDEENLGFYGRKAD